MISFAHAKINLGLFITEKRPDGYHNLETIFYPVKLYDVLEIQRAAEFSFQSFGITIPRDGKNLCEKAYELLKQDFDISPVGIHLLKNIPVGAGLGGGSSDAAFVLKAINELQSLGLTVDQLEAYAAKLGADCPFFIESKPVFATGTGTTFEPIVLDLSSFFIVIIKPDIHISTQEAYQNVTPKSNSLSLKEAIQLPIEEWKSKLINDFEVAIFEKYPIIAQLKNKMYDEGALFASMSGSGSSVFGIFEQKVDLDHLRDFGKIFYPIDL